MYRKCIAHIRKYGICHTMKKLIWKLYIRYFEGILRVNRKISSRQRKYEEDYFFEDAKTFSILVPLYNTSEKFLRSMIESVIAQTYAKWQLCLADGSDTAHAYVEEICRSYVEQEPRIFYQKLAENKGISENTNACIQMAVGEYIALFDHDDLLHPSALFEVMKEIAESGTDMVYTDEATFEGRESRLLSVHRKPDFCMENLRANNYICHFTVFQRKLLGLCGEFRKEFDGSQDFDLILRLCEKAENIRHIPKVLYFWRSHSESVAQNTANKSYAIDAGKRAVEAHLQRMGISAEVKVIQEGMAIYSILYSTETLPMDSVAVLHEGEEGQLEMQKDNPAISYLLLLKDGISCPGEAGMKMLLSHMIKPEVAAVTGKIINEKGRIVTAGLLLQEEGGRYLVKNLYKGFPANETGYMNRLLYPSGIDAICNGCMLIRKEYLQEVQAEELFSMQQWLQLSLSLRGKGLELINECRVAMVER